MKKFKVLFLVFSILAISGNLSAQERKGAELVIQKKDGTQVRGELIAVKENTLLLLERKSGIDVSADSEDVKTIKIVKKPEDYIFGWCSFWIGLPLFLLTFADL